MCLCVGGMSRRCPHLHIKRAMPGNKSRVIDVCPHRHNFTSEPRKRSLHVCTPICPRLPRPQRGVGAVGGQHAATYFGGAAVARRPLKLVFVFVIISPVEIAGWETRIRGAFGTTPREGGGGGDERDTLRIPC